MNKERHKRNPKEIMNPKEWKRLRLIELKEQGKVWSGK